MFDLLNNAFNRERDYFVRATRSMIFNKACIRADKIEKAATGFYKAKISVQLHEQYYNNVRNFHINIFHIKFSTF
jgi:hypothetical protein